MLRGDFFIMATKHKTKKSGRQNYDWTTIKADYVSDPKATLRNIAKKYGISMTTVAKKSKADNWFATRQKTQSDIATKVITKTANKQANELAKEMELLGKMKDRVTDTLSDPNQFHRHIKVDAVTGDIEDKLLDKVDTRALKDTMQVLKMIEDMSRSLYNIQKAEAIQRHQIEAERLQLERERLELEKERNALRNGDVGDSSKYGVVLMPEVLSNDE